MKTVMRSVSPVLAAGLFALLVAGCAGAASDLVVVGGKPFSQETLNDEANLEGQKKVLEKLAKVPPAAGADAVVAVTGQAEITGLDLKSGKTWSFPHPLDRRPTIAGPLVVGQGGGEVFALDAATGAVKWKSSKPKGKMIGAGSDGAITAVTTTTPEGSAVYVFGADGSVTFDKTTEMAVARPGVAAGIVFVPWKNLYVTAFDAQSGAQLATFVTDTETTHVLAMGGALFAGQGRLVRFDADLLKAKQGGSALAAPPKELPNVTRRDVLVGPDHDDKLPSDAIDSTALTGRPTTSGAAGWQSDRLYGAYYPLVLGFDAKTGGLAWVHALKSEVVQAHAAKDGVVVVDKSGTVTLLAAENGAVVKSYPLGKGVQSADAFADSISIGSGSSPSLSQQIQEAVTLKDDRLATAQVYLLEEAAKVPDEATTNVLLEVADSERAASQIKDAARKAIALRTNGADAMIKMLGRHADFLKGTKAPPVGAMAKALAAMKEKKAAGPLLEQLLDPSLPQIDLDGAAEGVAALADKEHLPKLQMFVNMYRGSATGNIKLSDAVGTICGAILRIDGDKGRAWVTAVSKDPLTDVDVKTTLEKVLEANKPKKSEEPKADDEKAEKADAKSKKKKVEDDGPEPPGYKKKKAKEKAEEKKAKGDKGAPEAKADEKPAAGKGDEKKEASPPDGKADAKKDK